MNESVTGTLTCRREQVSGDGGKREGMCVGGGNEGVCEGGRGGEEGMRECVRGKGRGGGSEGVCEGRRGGKEGVRGEGEGRRE